MSYTRSWFKGLHNESNWTLPSWERAINRQSHDISGHYHFARRLQLIKNVPSNFLLFLAHICILVFMPSYAWGWRLLLLRLKTCQREFQFQFVLQIAMPHKRKVRWGEESLINWMCSEAMSCESCVSVCVPCDCLSGPREITLAFLDLASYPSVLSRTWLHTYRLRLRQFAPRRQLINFPKWKIAQFITFKGVDCLWNLHV